MNLSDLLRIELQGVRTIKTKLLALVASAAVLLGGSTTALAVPIISGDGTETCTLGAILGGGACPVFSPVSPHAAWQPINPNGQGAVWISYADTGVLGSTLAPRNGGALNPTGVSIIATFTESFFAGIGDTLALDVWADDTAGVFIDGVLQMLPNFVQGTCAAGPIGCEPGENGTFNHVFAAAGMHTVSIDIYQVGTGTTNASNPLGLLYSGTLAVPAPATLGLLGIALLGLAGVGRRVHGRT